MSDSSGNYLIGAVSEVKDAMGYRIDHNCQHCTNSRFSDGGIRCHRNPDIPFKVESNGVCDRYDKR